MVEAVQNVTVASFCGSLGVHKRIIDLGFTRGSAIHVLRRDFQGPVIMTVRDSRLALGRGIAHKIMVEPC
jgi:ferrous iron transport protein A